MSRKFTIALAIVIIILGAIGARALVSQKKPAERNPPREQLKTVKTRSVKNQNLNTKVEVTGRLIPRQKIDIYTEVTGILEPTTPSFKEGNYFSEGKTLIKVNNEEHTLNLLAQRSSLMNQITLLLPDLKADFPEAFEAWQSYLNDFDVEDTTQPLPEPSSDREKYFISARNIYNLYYSIKGLEVRSDKYIIHAPFNGVVAESAIDQGTLVRSGQKLGAFINPYTYEMEAAVDLKNLDFIGIGSKVDLYSTDIEGKWEGKVVRISDRIDEQTQTAKIYVAVSGKELREGMYLNATITGELIEDVVEVPRKLLQEDSAIFVVQDSMLVLMNIKPVRYSTENVMVRGVPDSTAVLDESVIGAFEGMRVAPY